MTTDDPSGVQDACRRSLESLRGEEGRLSAQFNRLGWARGGCFVAAVVLAWLGAARGTPPLWWALVPVALFVALMIRHEAIDRRRARARRAVTFFERALARLEDRWTGQGDTGLRLRPDDHLYADDLDLFGDGSVFQLLCTAETPAGRETLAEWLLEPAPPAEVLARQAAVAELRGRDALRVDLAVLGAEVGEGIHRATLADWGSAPRVPFPSWSAPLALLLSLANAASVIGALWFGLPAWVALLSIVAGMALAGLMRNRVRAVVAGLERPARDLDHLAALLGRLEREAWSSPRLVELGRRLGGEGMPASRAVGALHRLSGLLDSRRNQLFMPVAGLLLWTTQLALAVERWRARHGAIVGRWAVALGEVEALASFATYWAEHPLHTMPELTGDGVPRYEASELVHPLLPRATAVANDVTLGGEAPRALLVSGSNMSGKSTLLRAVGVTAALAQAGAPVSAGRLRLSPLAIGASFRAQDSLQQGRSRFFAEIARLRRTVDLLETGRPVLFLLDELLSGTNSYDRALGARAVVEHLVRHGALGLVTTHDLALADIAETLAPLMANVHFEDRLEGGELHFDYRLRPGVVRRSNAVELMRAVGLPVGLQGPTAVPSVRTTGSGNTAPASPG